LFSLRSVEKFMPWIGRVFIVTDGQTPDWLDSSNPRVRIVDHAEIIPSRYLPLFNSSAIEMFIHKIDGLAEHFIYANDDMFAGGPLEPSYFFDSNGNPIVDVAPKRWHGDIFEDGCKALLSRQGDLWEKMVLRVSRAVFDEFGVRMALQPGHQMEAMRRSYLAENLEYPRFADWIERTRRMKFRDDGAVQRLLFPIMDSIRGRTTLRVHDKRRWWEKLFGLSPPAVSVVSSRCNIARIMRARPILFCVNDDEKANDKIRRRNRGFLASMFPDKSGFEK
jgi:hypothetical protein